MPPGGAVARAEQRATLARIAHELLDLGRSSASCSRSCATSRRQHGHESFEASVIRVTRRDYEKAAASRPSCAPR